MTILFKKLTNSSPIILLFLFLFILTTIIIAINRGFDFTDEGGFLLSYSNIDIYRGGIYNYHIIVNKLTDWMSPNIIGYRWMSLLLTTVSSIILTVGFQKWLKENFKNEYFFHNIFLLFGFISIGNFLFFFPGILTLYNNTLTNFTLQVSTGIILYLLSIRAGVLVKSNKNPLLILILGGLCSLSFFVKFPAGIIQVGLYLVSILIHLKNQALKEKALVILIFIGGVTLGMLCYFSFFQGISGWRLNFIKEYNILSDHSALFLIRNYLFEVLTLIKFSLKNFSWLLIFPGLILLTDYFKKRFTLERIRVFKNLILFFSIIFFVYQIYHFNFFRSLFANKDWINAYFYLIVISLQLIIIFAIKKFQKTKLLINWNIGITIFILLVTPFIGAVGTANPIFSNSLIHSATWFGVILILSIYLSNHINRNIVVPVFILIPGVVTASQIVDGNLFTPYYSVFNQNKANFFQQNKEVEEIPLLEGISVDVKTKEFLIGLNQILEENNFKKGDPIFGFHIPGVVYLMEGISPGVPYYFNKDRDKRAIECLGIGNTLPVILLNEENPINYELLMEMRTEGIDFPQEYVKKGEVYFPNTDSQMRVYFPKTYNF